MACQNWISVCAQAAGALARTAAAATEDNRIRVITETSLRPRRCIGGCQDCDVSVLLQSDDSPPRLCKERNPIFLPFAESAKGRCPRSGRRGQSINADASDPSVAV